MQPDWSLNVTQSQQCLMFVERTFTLKKRGARSLRHPTTCAQTCVPRKRESCAKHSIVLDQQQCLGAMSCLKGLISCGIVVETVSLCCFRNHFDSVAAVHGDDIFIAGQREEVLQIGALFEKRWRTRDQLTGAGSGDQEELHNLNRTLRWCRDGLAFVSDVRHVRGDLGSSALSRCF